MKFALVWYSDGNQLVGEEAPALEIDQVRQWFNIDPYDLWLGDVDYLVVTASKLAHVQAVAQHQIDLNKYDYFLKCSR